MKLLFASKSNFQYNRDLILLNGLKRRSDVEIETFQIKRRDWIAFRQIRKKSKEVDFVVVPSFRHKDVAFVKFASKAPLVFDPLISKYMTRVLDYGVKWKGPHKYIVDWFSYYWPNILIWDTESHGEYLQKKYRINKPMKPIYIGVDTSKFYPIHRPSYQKTIIGFYGSFNPLQGIDKIIRAAHLLKGEPSIEFRIIGNGSTYKKVKALADELNSGNIKFLPPVPYNELNQAINEFDICLGVFGESIKTDVVIPNKIYHYAATQKCIITKDTRGIKELFQHDQNIVLVPNDPKHLSEAIMSLANNIERRDKIAQSAYELVSEEYNQDKIAASFIEFLRTCS
ncbi:MAG: glycosyltransferase [Bacteroidota bacterium]